MCERQYISGYEVVLKNGIGYGVAYYPIGSKWIVKVAKARKENDEIILDYRSNGYLIFETEKVAKAVAKTILENILE